MAFISAHSWLSFWPIVDSFFLAFVVMPYLAHNWLIVSLLKKKKKKKKKKGVFPVQCFFLLVLSVLLPVQSIFRPSYKFADIVGGIDNKIIFPWP
jgi:hypothetical protein